MKTCCLILFIGFSFLSFAEYRAYEYYVKAKEFANTGDRAYVVTSTLDPIGYVAYHGGRESLKVDLLRSWICRGNTAGKPICPPPLDLVTPIVPFAPYLP